MEKICLQKLTLEPLDLDEGSWVEDDTQNSSALSSVVVSKNEDAKASKSPVVHVKRVR